MSEKCFCHLNGYAVKDSTARAGLEDLKNEVGMLGKFFDVVKVESSNGSPFLDIPNGSMGVAYIEYGSLIYHNTDGSLAGETGINCIDFCKDWSTIVSAQPVNMPGNIVIPDGANQIYFDCSYSYPPDTWDAGPYWFAGAIYFLVAKG